MPSSFATQMAMATGMIAKSSGADRDSNRMSRLMLAKMKTLEESLGEVVREMRVLRSAVPSTAHNSGDDGSERGARQFRTMGSGELSASSLGQPLIEVASHNRSTAIRRANTTSTGYRERPLDSRRVFRDRGAGLSPEEDLHDRSKSKGKEKEVFSPIEKEDIGDEALEHEERDQDRTFPRQGGSSGEESVGCQFTLVD